MASLYPWSARVCVEAVTSLGDEALREQLQQTPLGRTPGMAFGIMFPSPKMRLVGASPAPVGPEPIGQAVDRSWTLTRALMNQAGIGEGAALLAKVMPGAGTFSPPLVDDAQPEPTSGRSWKVILDALCHDRSDAEQLQARMTADAAGHAIEPFIRDGSGHGGRRVGVGISLVAGSPGDAVDMASAALREMCGRLGVAYDPTTMNGKITAGLPRNEEG